LSDLRQRYPDIIFECDHLSPTVNAQAINRFGLKVVRLYGGLAYHRAFAWNGLTLALLHEVGHHLGAGGRLPGNSRLACECVADRWVLTHGLRSFRSTFRRGLDIRKGVASFDTLTIKSNLPEAADPPSPCWSCNWNKRKNILLGSSRPPARRRCLLRNAFYEGFQSEETKNGCIDARR
jgi:hypothetical protein